MNEKIWSILIQLGPNMSANVYHELQWDEELWDTVLEKCVWTGINTIVLDVNDGLEYGSHPELALKGAWTRNRMRREIKRCRELGITLIPKLNFSTNHHRWLGVYSRMASTPQYYRVAYDLIRELYELFEHPKYFHLGMDEESAQYTEGREHCSFRQGELFWHDLRYLVDCVADLGAKPWIWSSPLFDHPEEFKAHFDPDEMIISPYHYNAFRPEHFTPIESRSEYLVYYSEGKYKDMGIKYVEEDPYLVQFIERAIPLMKEGYVYVPCASVFNRCKYNHDDLIEYFRDNAPDDQILGYMTAPWKKVIPEFRDFFMESFDAFKTAKEKFYY